MAGDFLIKNVMTSVTIYNIINENIIFEVNGQDGIFLDYPSAFVLVRTLFEGYINFHYLIFDPISEEERKIRLDMWDRHALLERERMADFIGSKAKKLQVEKQRIQQYTDIITNSTYFDQLPPSQKQSFLSTKSWTRDSILFRADKANIHRSHSNFIYKFLSNYAHSESYALMQINSIKSQEMAETMLKNLPIRYTEMFLTLTLNLFRQMFSKVNDIINKHAEVVHIIEQWEYLKTVDLKELQLLNR